MPSPSNFSPLKPRELADYGFERVRGIAFDAVRQLWQLRKAAGLLQKDLAKNIERDAGWVSKNLSGPGNWTMRTFGELVSGLDGEVEIRVRAAEDPLQVPTNYDAYASVVSKSPARIQTKTKYDQHFDPFFKTTKTYSANVALETTS